MAETTVLALYEEVDQAAVALNRIRDQGSFASDDLMVLSSVPFPEGVLDADDSKTHLPLIALCGAVAGIGLGLLITMGSAALYTIPTGGKPIEPAPSIGIISYEFMMLLALVGAFLGALFEMRLPNWRSRVYDPRISEGYIGIAAHCGSDTVASRVEDLLGDTGATDIKRDNRSFD